MTFLNEGTFIRTSSVQGLPVILKWHNLQRLDIALDIFIEFKFCESNFYFLNGSKNCMVATYNFGSMYMKTGQRICFFSSTQFNPSNRDFSSSLLVAEHARHTIFVPGLKLKWHIFLYHGFRLYAGST